MAALTFSPDERAQMAAIAHLRWRIFVNSLRSLRGRLEVVSRVFTALAFGVIGIGGMVGIGVASYFLVSRGNSEWLALPLWSVLFFWQLFPLLASAYAENFDLTNLLRFPLRYRSYFLVRLVHGSLDVGTAIGILWLLGMVAGIGCADPALLPWAVVVCVGFALMNVLLARMIFAWIERWLARRRTREVIGILFFLIIIGFQFIGPLLEHFRGRRAPVAIEGATRLLPLERVLPPGAAASAIAGAHHAQILWGAAGFALLCGYCALFAWILNLRVRAQFRGESLGESSAPSQTATRKGEIERGWKLPGVSPPVAAVFEKEIRYFLRSGPMLFTVLMPLVVLLIFRFTPGNPRHGSGSFLGSAAGLAFPAAAAYAILILTNFVGNNLGPDGGGVQFFFASPARFRSVMMGKNLAHAAVIAMELLLVWGAACLIFGMPSLPITIATLAGALFAVPLNFAVGNLLSLFAPKKIDFGAFGKQKPPSTTQFASLAGQVVLFGLAAIAFLIGRHSAGMWVTTAILLALAAVAFGVYAAMLNRAERVALDRREALLAELCKA
ncbi:MAG TPA: hypothetical protein VN661_07475 [Candidatus Acidoferrales bacterium]|nr:hypothetical protein [Candidatus Acidoferrales bacterium]